MIITDIRKVLSPCKKTDIILGEYTGQVQMLKIRVVSKFQGEQIADRKEEDNKKNTVLQKPRKCHQGVKDD